MEILQGINSSEQLLVASSKASEVHLTRRDARREKRFSAFADTQRQIINVLQAHTPDDIARMDRSAKEALISEAMVNLPTGRHLNNVIQGSVEQIINRESDIQHWWNGQNESSRVTNLVTQAYIKSGREMPTDINTANIKTERVYTGLILSNIPREVFADLMVQSIRRKENGIIEDIEGRDRVIEALRHTRELGVTLDARDFFGNENIPEGTKVILLAEGTSEKGLEHELEELLGIEIDEAIDRLPRAFYSLGAHTREEILGMDSLPIRIALHDIASRLATGESVFDLTALGIRAEDIDHYPQAVQMVQAINLAVQDHMQVFIKNHTPAEVIREQQKLGRIVQGGILEPRSLLQYLHHTQSVQSFIDEVNISQEDLLGEGRESIIPLMEGARFIKAGNDSEIRTRGDIVTIRTSTGDKRYAVHETIGSGGLASVYLVEEIDQEGKGNGRGSVLKEGVFDRWELALFQITLSNQQRIEYVDSLFQQSSPVDAAIFDLTAKREVDVTNNRMITSQKDKEIPDRFVEILKTQLRQDRSRWAVNMANELDSHNTLTILNDANEKIALKTHLLTAYQSLLQEPSILRQINNVLGDVYEVMREKDHLLILTQGGVRNVPAYRGFGIGKVMNGHAEHYVVDVLMDFIPGKSLDKLWIPPTGTQPQLDNLIEVVLEVVDTVEDANKAGIYNGDLKGDNILLDIDNRGNLKRVSIVDWLTPLGSGSPYYAAPEQFVSGPVTPQVEMHNIAAMMMQALGVNMEVTMQPLPNNYSNFKQNYLEIDGSFKAKYSEDKVRMLYERNTRLDRLKAERYIPQGLKEVLLKAMADDSTQRYADLAAFKTALKSIRYDDDKIIVAYNAIPTGQNTPDLGNIPQEISDYLAAVTNLLQSRTPESAFQQLKAYATSGKDATYGGILAAYGARHIMENRWQRRGLQIISPRTLELTYNWLSLLDEAGDTTLVGNRLQVALSKDMVDEINGFSTYLQTLIKGASTVGDFQLIAGFLAKMGIESGTMKNPKLKLILQRQLVPHMVNVLRVLQNSGVTLEQSWLDGIDVCVKKYTIPLDFPAAGNALNADQEIWFKPLEIYFTLIANEANRRSPAEKMTIRQRLEALKAEFETRSANTKNGFESHAVNSLNTQISSIS